MAPLTEPTCVIGPIVAVLKKTRFSKSSPDTTCACKSRSFPCTNAFCSAVATYGAGDKGTPGAQNVECESDAGADGGTGAAGGRAGDAGASASDAGVSAGNAGDETRGLLAALAACRTQPRPR